MLKSRFLILSCSQRKRSDDQPLPAIERYDGPTFQVLRRFMREQDSEALDAYVLSAKHGLIAGEEPIRKYDRILTPERAAELQPKVASQLVNAVSSAKHEELLICAGRSYLDLLRNGVEAVSTKISVEVASGTVGRQLSSLYKWLYGEAAVPETEEVDTSESVALRVRGTEITLTPSEARKTLREALREEQGKPKRYQSWYTVIDGERVSIKWAVAQLIGLSVGDFHTDDAKRALQQLGITIQSR